MSARLDALRDRLSASEVDALLSLDAVTNDYLSNFSGSTSAVIVTVNRAVLVTDFRYREQARAEVSGFELREASDSYMREVCRALSDTGARKVGFEPDRMTVKSYREVGKWLSTVELVAMDGLVSGLRACCFPRAVLIPTERPPFVAPRGRSFAFPSNAMSARQRPSTG